MSKLWTEDKIKEEAVSGSWFFGLVKTSDDTVAISEIYPGIGFTPLDEGFILGGENKDDILIGIL